MKTGKILICLGILLALEVQIAAKLVPGPEEVISQYIDALKQKDWSKAESLWMNGDIEKSRHLGIEYVGIEAKYDCVSPLVYTDANILDSPCGINTGVEYIDSVTAKIGLNLSCPSNNIQSISYYAVKTEDGWRLCSSMHAYARDWLALTTHYFNIHFTDSSLINQYALDALDSFVDSLGTVFKIAPERMKTLENSKIDYYLCSEFQIKLLTGYDAHGMTSLPFDAIITRHLPHLHEITHLIVNYALKRAPLFTLPIFQEGLACCLGGRWGKSPDVINYWGSAVIGMGLADLDSLLTQAAFNGCTSGLDATYAVSSLFSRSLIDNYGIDKYMALYLKLSGDADYMKGLNRETIIRTAEMFTVDKWANIKLNFKNTAQNYRYAGIIPGDVNPIKEKIQLAPTDNPGVKMWEAEDFYIIDISLPSDRPGGAILFKNDDEIDMADYYSWQFKEHFPDKAYDGKSYGIIFNIQEAGLYNYLTNTLLAKYVMSFSPSDKFFDPSNNTITFSIDKKVLARNVNLQQSEIILNE